METKELISSYDEINDTFVGKMSGKDGYLANFDISNGVFLNIDKNKLPASIHINKASNVLDVEKSVLEDDDVSIFISCGGKHIDFEFFIADKMIYKANCANIFNISQFSYEIKTN